MIISASRRTDIPAFHFDWFLEGVRRRYVTIPKGKQEEQRVSLNPENVDAIVFWTKNPSPMLDKLEELKEFNYYFQFTLNAYDKSIEPNVPLKNNVIIPTFQRLSDKLGSNRVLWRYDPIMFSPELTTDYHLRWFERLAKKLKGYTTRCTISFLDVYPKIQGFVENFEIKELCSDEKILFLQKLNGIAQENGIQLFMCSEEYHYELLGIKRASCIDKNLIESLFNIKLNVGKDASQRRLCGCCSSIDIGIYNTCGHHCRYCYASKSKKPDLLKISVD